MVLDLYILKLMVIMMSVMIRSQMLFIRIWRPSQAAHGHPAETRTYEFTIGCQLS